MMTSVRILLRPMHVNAAMTTPATSMLTLLRCMVCSSVLLVLGGVTDLAVANSETDLVNALCSCMVTVIHAVNQVHTHAYNRS